MGKEMKYKDLFGPVLSRRLGMSLGVDLMPHKTCSMDCVYCECGPTTKLTTVLKEYVPTRKVIEELSDFLGKKPKLDYVTFSGSGEPTLHSGIGRIIEFVKKNFAEYKIALLTNGSMFSNADVRRNVIHADLILPSLDAVSEGNFKKINKPFGLMDNKKIIAGLVSLRKAFKGKILLEIFIVPGINDSQTELRLLKNAVKKIRPDMVQINTLDRPGTEDWVVPAGMDKLKAVAKYFGKNTEIVAKAGNNKSRKGYFIKTENEILDTIKRRPCTFGDLLNITGLTKSGLKKYTENLLSEGKIAPERQPRGVFFKARD